MDVERPTGLHIDIVTLFPEMFAGPFDHSMVGRAREKGLVDIRLVGLRPFGVGIHQITDDYPYGGGAGMLMRPEPLVEACEWAMAQVPKPAKILVTSAQGTVVSEPQLEAWARLPYLILVAGHYEGIDQRAIEILGAEEVSLGDYVLTGGELAAMVITDGVVRLLPGVLGAQDGAQTDSFSQADRWLEGPQYTRPWEFRGRVVPEVLKSGDHQRIAAWRREQSRRVTTERRPDLL